MHGGSKKFKTIINHGTADVEAYFIIFEIRYIIS